MVRRLCNVLRKRPAPISSSSEKSTCETTNKRDKPKRGRAGVVTFSAAPTFGRVMIHAGASPNRRAVSTDTLNVNDKIRRFGATSIGIGEESPETNINNARLPHHAKSNP